MKREEGKVSLIGIFFVFAVIILLAIEILLSNYYKIKNQEKEDVNGEVIEVSANEKVVIEEDNDDETEKMSKEKIETVEFTEELYEKYLSHLICVEKDDDETYTLYFNLLEKVNPEITLKQYNDLKEGKTIELLGMKFSTTDEGNNEAKEAGYDLLLISGNGINYYYAKLDNDKVILMEYSEFFVGKNNINIASTIVKKDFEMDGTTISEWYDAYINTDDNWLIGNIEDIILEEKEELGEYEIFGYGEEAKFNNSKLVSFCYTGN